MKNLILVDDHKMLRKGISAYFTENSQWNVIAEAESLDDIPNILKKIGEDPYIRKKMTGREYRILLVIVNLFFNLKRNIRIPTRRKIARSRLLTFR